MDSNKKIIIEFLIYILVVLLIILIIGFVIIKKPNSDNLVLNADKNTNNNLINNSNNLSNKSNHIINNNQNINYSELDVADNTNIVLNNQNFNPTIEWMAISDNRYGTGNEIITKIEIDKNNNLYAVGYTDDDFGVRKGGNFDSDGFDDYFLIKYLPNGNAEFVISPTNGLKNDYINDIFLKNKYLYITGKTDSDLSFKINKNNIPDKYNYKEYKNYGADDFYCAKYNNDDAIMTFFAEGDTTKNDFAKFIYVDIADSVYLIGETETKIDFRNNVKFKNIGDNDIFIVKFDKYSNTKFAINPLIGYEFKNTKLVDYYVSGEDIYILGQADIEYSINGKLNDNAKTFISKITFNGKLEWTKVFPGNDENTPVKIIIDSDKNIFVGLNFEKEIYIDDVEIKNNGDIDFLLLKLNNNANMEWFIHPSLSPDDDEIIDFDIDEENDLLYIAGKTEGYIEFDFDILLHSGRSDFFINQYNLNGELNWIRSANGKTGRFKDEPLKIIAKKNGAFLALNTESDIDFGNNIEFINQGDYDFVVVKYDKNGTPLWIISSEESREYLDDDEPRSQYINDKIDVEFSGKEEDTLSDIIITDHFLYLSGITKGNLDFTDDRILKNKGGYDFFILKYALNN